jgi:uncharacterized membrane protein YiaA
VEAVPGVESAGVTDTLPLGPVIALLTGITTAITRLFGATISNEEGYFTAKLMRGLGTVYLEQQARV